MLKSDGEVMKQLFLQILDYLKYLFLKNIIIED
jgi:hypothetical protein